MFCYSEQAHNDHYTSIHDAHCYSKPPRHFIRHVQEPHGRNAGFPEMDPIMDRYVTADVEAWMESRRQIKTGDILDVHTQEVNLDAL
ncbi:MAG: hypothetical protein ACJAZ1_003433 [Yoonia sp.]|jgi:hypothetical protein